MFLLEIIETVFLKTHSQVYALLHYKLWDLAKIEQYYASVF